MAKASVNENLIVNITNTETIALAETTKDLHTKLTEAEGKFSDSKDGLVAKIKEQWEKDTKETALFPRNYKAETTMGVVQVEAKVTSAKGTMEVSAEKELDTLFGVYVDTLFEKSKVMDQLVDKRAVIKILLTNPAVNLNDIEISIKNPNLLELIKKESKGALTTKEVILPKAGFLELLSEIPEAVRKFSRDFVKQYLDQCMSFTVVCGNRGKKA